MNKIFRALALFLCLIIPRTAEPYPRAEFEVDVAQIVKVNDRCTGWVAFPNVVVTAAHCIFNPERPQVIKFNDGAYYKFELIEMGELGPKDYALLRGDTRGIDPIPLGEEPEVGGQCYWAGYGGARAQQYALRCQVQSRHPQYEDWIHIAGEAIGGDSGSPLMDSEGRVFGIVVAGFVDTPVSFATDIAYVREAYQRYLISNL